MSAMECAASGGALACGARDMRENECSDTFDSSGAEPKRRRFRRSPNHFGRAPADVARVLKPAISVRSFRLQDASRLLRATAAAPGRSMLRPYNDRGLKPALHTKRAFAACLLFLAFSLSGCGRKASAPADVRLFHAAGLTPVVDALREPCKALGLNLLAEGSGSQVACRKLTELGRPCDVILLADSDLVATMLKGSCSWRLDFACDQMVLAVGARAPEVSRAEQEWPPVLLLDNARLGRANENTSPIGYRTLLVWKLEERRRGTPLYDRLVAKATKVVDDVERLTPLLKNGELDYAFTYRSTCIAHDIRYIELDRSVNLGSLDADYSAAEVQFKKLQSGAAETVTVKGAPICWTLSIPDQGADEAAALKFIRCLIGPQAGLLERNGFALITRPRFHGPKEKFAAFQNIADYAGELRP